MAQFFMDFYGSGGPKDMGGRLKVFSNLVDARKHAMLFLKTQFRLTEKKFDNYSKYGSEMPYAVYGVGINTIKNGIISRCGFVGVKRTTSGGVKFVWTGYSTTKSRSEITINSDGTLRKGSVKKKASPFGL